MNLLKDIITYVRRIIKTPSNAVITDSLIIDYINRFWLMDVDARIQVFDLKTKYQFLTKPGIDTYNMPLYDTQTEIVSTTPISVDLVVEPFTDGTALYFNDLLAQFKQSDPNITLSPGTIVFWLDKGLAGQSVYIDDGLGNVTLSSGTYTIASGTIDYLTGILVLNFTVTPLAGVAALASFIYISTKLGETIAMFPVYQGFMGPAYINGIEGSFYTMRDQFYAQWSGYSQTSIQVETGNGTRGPYTLNLPFLPNFPNPINFPVNSGIIRGHVDIMGIIATGLNVDPPLDLVGDGSLIPIIPSTSISSEVFFTSTAADASNIVVQDTGIFLAGNQNYGLLMEPGKAPYGNKVLTGANPINYSTTQNTINYLTGVATNVFFPQVVPQGMPINARCIYYQTGIPRSALWYNNVITLRCPPNTQYVVEFDAFLTPAAFFNTAAAIPFAYMAEYIARGAARKILSDVGDVEQFEFYEQFFTEQESLVHIRSQRQWTATRSPTIYFGNSSHNGYNQGSLGV